MTEPTRQEQLAARADRLGYALIPPSGDRWLLVDKADTCETFASLDQVEVHLELAAEEEKERRSDPADEDPGLIGPDAPGEPQPGWAQALWPPPPPYQGPQPWAHGLT